MGHNTYTNINIDNWDTSNVTNIKHMFYGSSKLNHNETYILLKILPILDLDHDDLKYKSTEYIKSKIDKLKNMAWNRDGRITSSLKKDVSNSGIGIYAKNRDYLQGEMLNLLDISKEDMWNRDEAWIKGKIRNLKLKILDK
jgi:hypothetical protein